MTNISEEKIKIVINNYFKTECSVDTTIREAFEKGFRLGIRKVKEQECQWIPVSERLPESSIYVLVTTNDGIITTGIIRESNNEKFWWHRMHEFKEKEIVAWMPLPESYREKQEHD